MCPTPCCWRRSPETLDKTLTRHLKRGGVIIALARKPLILHHISATYRLDGGKLTLVRDAPKIAQKPKIAVVADTAKLRR